MSATLDLADETFQHLRERLILSGGAKSLNADGFYVMLLPSFAMSENGSQDAKAGWRGLCIRAAFCDFYRMVDLPISEPHGTFSEFEPGCMV